MQRLSGILLVALSAVTFGTFAIFARFAFAAGADPLTALFLRLALAALVMWPLLAARREPLPRGPILARLIAMGAVGYVGQSLAYLTALQFASAGLVALLLYLYPVIVALLAALVFGERISRPKAAAVAIAFTGIALVVGPSGGSALGIALALSCALIYSVYIITGTALRAGVSALQSSTVIFTAAGATAGLLTTFNGMQLPQGTTGWWAIAGMVVFATVIPVAAFLAGLKRIGPTNAAMLSTLEPVKTVLPAMVFLGETLTALTLVGGGLILAAVLLLSLSELRAARQQPGEATVTAD